VRNEKQARRQTAIRRFSALSVGLVLALVLSACGGSSPPRSTSTPSSTESARLAAAIDAFTVFNATFDGYSSGTDSVDSLRPLVTAGYFQTLEDENAVFLEQRVSGATSFDTVELSSAGAESNPDSAIAITLCRDMSETEVVDRTGNVIEVPGRALRVALIVYFVPSPSDPKNLLVSEMDQWPSPNYCS
jgi:hypothetical protein